MSMAGGPNAFSGAGCRARGRTSASATADAATQREPRNPRASNDAASGREAVQLGLTIELPPQNAALRAHGTGADVDEDTLHRREIDHQPPGVAPHIRSR